MKTALFLGAGASVFASMPTTVELLARVRDRIREHKGNPPRSKALQEYVTRVVEDSTYGDVEKLYDGMDRIIAISGKPSCNPIIGQARVGDVQYGEIIDELNSLKGTIRKVLLESFSTNTNALEQIKQTYDEVRLIMKAYGTGKLHVFTTNYDLVVEEYCAMAGLDVVNGFKPYGHLSKVWSNSWDHEGEKSPLYLTKLHGSIAWHKNDGGRIIESGTVAQRDANADIMIAPTEGAKEYDKEPFPELIDHFKKAIEKVDVLLVIGFSYRDKEITNIIKNRVGEGMMLISLSPSTVTDIYRMLGADIKIKETANQQIKATDSGIILCEQEFGSSVDQTMNAALNMVYKRIRRSRRHALYGDQVRDGALRR